MDPREAQGLRRELNRNSKMLKRKHRKIEPNLDLGAHGPGVSHGGFGRSSLQECLDRLNQTRVDAPAVSSRLRHRGLSRSADI